MTAVTFEGAMAPAGVDWDAIRVPRFVGLQVIELLGPQVGPVIVNPAARTMYFLVPPGTTAAWTTLAPTTVLGKGSHVFLPARHQQKPPGPYWLTPCRQPLADTPTLRTTLASLLDSHPDTALDPRLDLTRLTFNQVKGWDCALCGSRLHADRSLGIHRSDTGLLTEPTELWACAPVCRP
ncbi:hypothetical protein [Streptomyces sp. bgisy091]|uniref:hypothetical protein n=1 Tax=Streptomyces sp. bgisy091 TaxID=3413778 RepID=UPI003D74C82B